MLIFYQSLNSSSTYDHGLKSATTQLFTRQTHNNMASSNFGQPNIFLQMPDSSSAPDQIFQGPQARLSLAQHGAMDKGSHTEKQMLSLIEIKIKDILQTGARLTSPGGFVTAQLPDILVLGEVDGQHPEWASLTQYAGNLLPYPNKSEKASQSFSVYSRVSGAGIVTSDIGWVAVRVSGIVLVFVHVPNDRATNPELTKKFYEHMKVKLGPIPPYLIMGDTNQQNDGHTLNCVNAAFPDKYKSVFGFHNDFETTDTTTRHGGTNSNSKKMYDTAVYQSSGAHVPKGAYISQFTMDPDTHQAVAVTDHMGMFVVL